MTCGALPKAHANWNAGGAAGFSRSRVEKRRDEVSRTSAGLLTQAGCEQICYSPMADRRDQCAGLTILEALSEATILEN